MTLNVLAEGGEGFGLGSFLPIIAMFGLMYFLIFRPQQKKQKEDQKMREELKKGDQIVTIGGIHGTVTFANDKELKIKVAEDTVLTIEKTAVASVKSLVVESDSKEK